MLARAFPELEVRCDGRNDARQDRNGRSPRDDVLLDAWVALA